MKSNIRQWFAAASALLCIAVSLCYGLKPDMFAAVTFFPAWVWLVPGIIITVPAFKAKHRRWLFTVFGMWAVFALVFNEEPRSIIRRPGISKAQLQSDVNRGRAVRVITLNCSGGNSKAAAEVRKYRPDIVLLQESPSESDIKRLTRELFGSHGGYTCTADDSILARGHVQPHTPSSDNRLICASAHVKLCSGFELEAISLRLVPPVVRLDLWSPNCWNEYAGNRRIRRDQTKQIANIIAGLPRHLPIIAGGDFNAPAGDDIFEHLCPRMHDTFAEHGVGWGNTVLNDFPVQRVDQIWADKRFHAVSVRAYKTHNSDHRMVVCDLLLH
ncbi:endonuclease/exonuclease/phosphatase family protein [bacterium]|nr:endonuclease/exonuclease/phosphatase family protein [bacterium]